VTSSDELASEAHIQWDLLEYAAAADLFLQAAEIESADAKRRSKWAAPDRWFLLRMQAAFCQWSNGDFDVARPTLLEALDFDWRAARLWGDRHFGEKAFASLLLEIAATNDAARFTQLWDWATKRGEELQYPFPTAIHRTPTD
jgi:hypothetical protein